MAHTYGKPQRSNTLDKNNNFIISVSPNGKELASLDISNNKLQTWKFKGNKLIPTDHDWQRSYHSSLNTNSSLISWAISVSDRDKNNNMYIAISKIYDSDIKVKTKEEENNLKKEEEDPLKKIIVFNNHDNLPSPSGSSISSNTFYDASSITSSISISTISSDTIIANHEEQVNDKQAIIIIHIKDNQTNEIPCPSIKELKGGIIKFIDSTTLIVLRGTELTRIILDNNRLHSNTIIPYPESMIHGLKMRSLKSNKAQLSSTVIRNYFFLCKSNQENKIFEMYDLCDLELKNVFHISADHEYTNDGGTRTSLYTISENGKLLAVSLCKKVVTIFLIENSLLVARVATEEFCKNKNSVNTKKSSKILDMKFFDNDEKLVILTREKNENGEEEVYTTIWNLFNCNIAHPYTNHLNPNDRKSFINNQIKTFKQDKGRPLGIFSNSLVYSIRGTTGIELIPFNKEKDFENEYDIMFNNYKDDFYNPDHLVRNFNQKIVYKVFDCNGEILYDFDTSKLIIGDSEPWNTTNKLQIIVWLNEKKTIQLTIGTETIQVWEKDKELVYIWTPLLSQSYYLDPFLPKSMEQPCKIHQFILKKFKRKDQYQYEIKFSLGNKSYVKRLPREKDYIISTCNAVEFLEWQMKNTVDLDNKLRRYLNKTIEETRSLIKEFIRKQPQTWRLLDIKECTMSHLVAAKCDDLVSYIVNENRHLGLHTPRRYAWSDKEIQECEIIMQIEKKQSDFYKRRDIPLITQTNQQEKKFDPNDNNYLKKPSDLKIAINLANKNAIKGLVNYYSGLAMDNAGWMSTVSDELSELYEYNPDYIVELFYKPIFGAKEAPHLSEACITSGTPLPGSKNSIHALHGIPTELVQPPKTKHSKSLELPDATPWAMTCMVPLPDFTVPKDQKGKTSSFGDKQSTFFQMVLKSSLTDDMDFIFDNPAMEATVNFKWYKYAKKIIYILLTLYALYQFCFTFLCYAYITHMSSSRWEWNLFYPFSILVIVFGGFLLFCEGVQMLYLKTKYFRIYNIFDLLSCVSPLACTVIFIKISLKNGFENIETNENLLISLSLTTLVLWIELLLRMRSLPIIGEYVFIIINLSKRIAPFLGAMLVIICGLAHSMFILLSHPENIGLQPNLAKYNAVNSVSNEHFQLTEDINVDDSNDNFFVHFFSSVIAVYFWINGRWDTLDRWDFWPVVALSIFGSLFLVIIMQNILIALMSDVVDEAKEIGKRAFLKLRAELIVEVESIFLTKKQLQDKNLFPRYIYYIINYDEASLWLNERGRRRNYYGEKLQEKDYGLLGKKNKEKRDSKNLINETSILSSPKSPFF